MNLQQRYRNEDNEEIIIAIDVDGWDGVPCLNGRLQCEIL